MTFLLFPLPTTITQNIAKYRQDAYYSNLFVDNNLRIQVFPTGKYIPMFEGTETTYIQGYREVFEQIGAKRYGFELRIQDGRQAIYQVLVALINDAYSDRCNPKTIECWDFVEDEGDDNGYIVRQGRIADLVKQQGGVACRKRYGKQRKISQGLTFQFLERETRFIGR